MVFFHYDLVGSLVHSTKFPVKQNLCRNLNPKFGKFVWCGSRDGDDLCLKTTPSAITTTTGTTTTTGVDRGNRVFLSHPAKVVPPGKGLPVRSFQGN